MWVARKRTYLTRPGGVKAHAERRPNGPSTERLDHRQCRSEYAPWRGRTLSHRSVQLENIMDYEDNDDQTLPRLKLDVSLIRSPNLADRFDEDQLRHLGHKVVEDFERDRNSRTEWETRMDNAMKLALQVTEKKTFPWEGAANVKFPLITICAIQYQSRAYPALVSGPYPVAAAPLAPRPNPRFPTGLAQAAQQDPQAKQALQQIVQQAQKALATYQEMEDRATRISHHMSYQILEEDETWEENHDKALLIQAIMGCVFKKTYFDPIKCHNISECVNPRDLVVSYWAKSVETAPRLTHIIYLSSNECYERAARGIFCDIYEDTPAPEPRLNQLMNAEKDKRQGTTPIPYDEDTPYELLEQACYLDLDGDGYAEPYNVTVRYDTRQVLRIVPRFTRADITYGANKKVLRIDPVQAFTKYPLIPSPDGGFYDLGLGALLGPINETIDSSINQLLDAGTLKNAGGGFLGRGFKNKRGEYRFRPGEWKSVDSTGDDLRKNILPLPAVEPSPVLFQLLTLLIEYGEAIAGSTDMLQGKNPGQNTPAETSRAMVEQGMKVFNGIYKRTHRAQTQEFRKLYRLNTIYITDDLPYYLGTMSPVSKVMAKDYRDAGLVVKCSADPFYMSDAQRYNQAFSMREASMTSPGYNRYEVEKNFLCALKISDVDRYLPDPTGPYAVPPPQNPKIQIEQMKQEVANTKQQLDYKIKLLTLVQGAEKMQAEIKKLEADSVLAMAQAKGVDAGHMIAMLDLQIAQKKAKMDGMLEAVKLLHEVMGGGEESGGSQSGGSTGVAGASGNAGSSSQLVPAATGVAGAMGVPSLPK